MKFVELLGRALAAAGIERHRVWTCHCGQRIRVDVARLTVDVCRARCGACKCVLPDRATDVEEFIVASARDAWARGGGEPVNVPQGAGGFRN